LDTGEILESRYRIDALLGQGCMGAVYRAVDLKFSALVAIKENRQFAPEGQRQIAREAGLLHQLRHPNLPGVTDRFFRPGRGQYLVMDYVEGGDLEQILARQGCLSQAQVLGIIDRVLDALTFLHAPDIVHRDVKSAKIKITPAGQVFLVDFGLAKAQAASKSTTAGARGVTPGYAPPEQYGYWRADARTDVYSAGATLYALLTGQKLPDALERMMRQVELVPLRQICPEIHLEVQAAVLHAMECTPHDRFQTVKELQVALQAASGVARPVAPGPLSKGALPARPARGATSRWLWPAAGALALLAVLVCVAVALAGLGGSEGESTAVAPTMLAVAVSSASPQQPTVGLTSTMALSPTWKEVPSPTAALLAALALTEAILPPEPGTSSSTPAPTVTIASSPMPTVPTDRDAFPFSHCRPAAVCAACGSRVW